MIEEIMGNVVDEYFRGSSSYEDAVTNRLNVLEATGIATTVAVSNMKSDLNDAINATTSEVQGLRSDFQAAAVGLYNQGQSIRNDIQNMTMGVTSAIQESTYALLASQSMLAENFKQGFNAVNNTLDFGFNLVGNKIDVFSDKICTKLDEIHDILNNPRLTQSRELYREALRSYQKGYFEEALEDCKGAVEKNKTDFISWYLLGMIYLFGAGKFSNVIDLDKAEEALANAAKYIDSDIGQSEEANLFASEIYYYLGLTKLIKSNDYLIENKFDDSNLKLLEAEKASSTAYKLSNKNLVAKYEQAKELHFLGKDDESLNLLEELIKEEKNFAIKAINDKNFETLWSRVEAFIEKLRKEGIQLIKDSFEQVISNSLKMLEKNFELCRVMIEDDKLLNNDRKNKLINELENTKANNLIDFSYDNGKIQSILKGIEDKDYFSVLATAEIEYKEIEKFYEHVKNLMKSTEDRTIERIKKEGDDQRSCEAKERREREEEERRKCEEERKLKDEEERRKREEERKLKEEEELRKRCEERRKRKEEAERKSKKRKVIYNIILSIGVGCILLYMRSDFRYTKLLFKAIKKYDVEKVEKYIKKGANVNAKKGKSGSTPIFYMLNSIHPGVNKRYNKIYEGFFNKLGDCKTNNVYENIEHFGLEWYKQPFQIFDLLINAGADINVANNYGVTPLMLSSYFLARCTNEETDHQIFICIEKMLDLGADVNAKTKSGITALQINEYGHYWYEENKASNMKYKQKVIDLLRKNGAKE